MLIIKNSDCFDIQFEIRLASIIEKVFIDQIFNI